MGMRQLTDQEKHFIEKQIDRLNEEKKFLFIEHKQAAMNLHEILPMNYHKKRRELEMQLRLLEENLREREVAVMDLDRQMREGVQEKEENNDG